MIDKNFEGTRSSYSWTGVMSWSSLWTLIVLIHKTQDKKESTCAPVKLSHIARRLSASFSSCFLTCINCDAWKEDFQLDLLILVFGFKPGRAAKAPWACFYHAFPFSKGTLQFARHCSEAAWLLSSCTNPFELEEKISVKLKVTALPHNWLRAIETM